MFVILRRQAKISFLTFYFVGLEIFPFVQNDKLGFVGVNCISCVGVGVSTTRCRGGFPRPPVIPPSDEGRLPHGVREMSRSDRGRPPPSAGGTA